MHEEEEEEESPLGQVSVRENEDRIRGFLSAQTGHSTFEIPMERVKRKRNKISKRV